MTIYIEVKDICCYRSKDNYDAEVSFCVDRSYYDSNSKRVDNRVGQQRLVARSLTEHQANSLSQEVQAQLVSILEQTAEKFLSQYQKAQP